MALNSSLPSELQPAPGVVSCPRDGAGEPGHPTFGTAMQPGSLHVTTAGNRLLGFGKNINGAGMAAVQTIGNVEDPAPIKPVLRLCPSCRTGTHGSVPCHAAGGTCSCHELVACPMCVCQTPTGWKQPSSSRWELPGTNGALRAAATPLLQGCSPSPVRVPSRLLPRDWVAPSERRRLRQRASPVPRGSGPRQRPAVAPHPPKPYATEGPFVSPLPSRYLLFSSSLFFPLHSSLKKTTDFPACLLVLY